jgi:hypothetical protein
MGVRIPLSPLAYNKVHGYFARDAMSYGLNYYNKNNDLDYTAIGNVDTVSMKGAGAG